MHPDFKKILYYIVAVTGLSAIFHGFGLWNFLPWHIVYSDVLGFWNRVSEAGFPYLSKNVEYPVLTGLFMEFWGALGGGRAGYYWLNSVALVLATLATTFLIYKTANQEERRRLWRYWVFAPSMLIFAVYNWDMLAILFSVAAFYFIRRGNNHAAAAFIALGFSAKFFPIIYLAPLLIQPKSIIAKLKIFGAFLGTAAVVNAPFLIANPSGWFYFFTFNSARNSNPDSIWTVARFLFGEIGIPTINVLSLLLFAAGFGFILWRYRRLSAISLCFAGTIVFLLTNKVFSPQYTLWLLPFFVLAIEPRKTWFYALEFSNIIILFVILRWFLLGQDIIYFYIALPFILLRHGSLIAILTRILRQSRFTVS